MKLNNNVIAFTGGGTGGHIYPGLAVADEIREIAESKNIKLEINWIGCSTGMDRKIVESARNSKGELSADRFFGISSGKLRRYFSWKNFTDCFKIIAGYFSARRILKKIKPAVLFSKGGFVSVPPCLAAKHLGIPVFTHECDFTLGLANRINFKSAKKMFVSYEETKNRLGTEDQKRVIVTGNPVRPVFYNADYKKGLDFLGLSENEKNAKPVLMILGGSSGARQINELVFNNLDWLCERFTVIHQTGLLNNDEKSEKNLSEKYGKSYKPYQFIYEQMPDVLAVNDVILSRAGANSLWETAVQLKPMVLIPLCGSGTRGDQVDNAEFFKSKNAAEVLVGDEATSENLKKALEVMLIPENRKTYAESLKNLISDEKPARKIAEIIFSEMEK